MLVRLLIKNLFSFKELTEFNMVPGKCSRLSHHAVKTNGIDLLKLNAIYGANGAGKSNLIRTLAILKDFLLNGEMPIAFITETFKFDEGSDSKDVYLGIEFIKDDTPYYYGLTINQGIIIEEELQISGFGKKDDYVLFLRTDKNGAKDLEISFSKDVQQDAEASLFPTFLKNKILERNTPVLFHMKNRQHKVFEPFKSAVEWFEKELEIISSDSWPWDLVLQLEKNPAFLHFTKDMIKTFNTGVTNIHIDTIPIEAFFGENNKQTAVRIKADLRAKSGKAKLRHNQYKDVVFVFEENKPVAKRILFSHSEDEGKARFELSEESDGTRRLLECLPALFSAVYKCKTYFVDEIERGIHPLLIKELVKKFSHDPETKGQLIFSTHESNLLDEEIFRPDEIWFAEKDKDGATELFTLSEFKEHHSIDIRTGYLNGRYGGIPFLGNLKTLNWGKYNQAN